jgi:hypothetical protein
LPALAISLVSSGLVIALFNQSGESLKESAVHYSSVAQDVMSRFVGHLKDASLGSLAVVRDIVVLTPRFVKYVMTSPNVWAAGLGVLGFWGLTYAF